MFKKIMKSIRTNALVGIVLVTPIVATILIFNFFLVHATNWMAEMGAFENLQDTWIEMPLRFAILMLLIVIFYVVGLLVRNVLGRRLFRVGDKMLAGLPLIKGIYVAVRQISEALFTQRKTLFKDAVVVEYPRKGLYSVAFVTANVPPDMARMMMPDKDVGPCITLFVPTTPNPTSGILIVVPKAETTPLNIPVTDALTFVMSAGAVIPGKDGEPAPTLLDKLETWMKHEEAGVTEEPPHDK